MHTAATHHGLQVIVTKAQIYLAMNMLSTSIGAAQVRLQAKPSKRVFAEKHFKLHECVLVAESTNIFVPAKGANPPTSAVEVPEAKCSQDPDAKFYLSPPSMTAEPCASPTGASLHSAFWCVRQGTAAEVSMEKSFRQISITVKGQASKTSKVDISVPVLQNTKPLNIGDELVILKIKPDESKDPKAKAKAASKSASKASNTESSGAAAKRQRRA